MSEAYIVEAVRTAIGRGRPDGALAPIHPVKLLAISLEEVCKRAGVEKGQIEDIIVGCVSPTGEQGANIARLGRLVGELRSTAAPDAAMLSVALGELRGLTG